MDNHRKHWNAQQQALRKALQTAAKSEANRALAIDLFLQQYAMLHPREATGWQGWSLEDEIWQELSEGAARWIPPKGEHSIAWLIWHLARIEDVTMNVLAAGQPQLFHQQGWDKKLNVPFCEVGNSMTLEQVKEFSAAVDLTALRGYRSAVTGRVRELAQGFSAQDLNHPVQRERLEQLMAEGAVIEGAYGLLDYWGGLTVSGLLLMPPTRHNLVHLNEAEKIKQKYR